jgi:cell division GTPase FtsZ
MNEVLLALKIATDAANSAPVSADLGDIREMIGGAEYACAASETADGEGACRAAAAKNVAVLEKALGSRKAKGLLVAFTSGQDIELCELDAAIAKMSETLCAEDANVIWACKRNADGGAEHVVSVSAIAAA